MSTISVKFNPIRRFQKLSTKQFDKSFDYNEYIMY